MLSLSGLVEAGKTEEHQRNCGNFARTGQTVKAILETTLLTDAEKRLAA